jgi:hypothetical protein
MDRRHQHDPAGTRGLLAAVAALAGYPRLADVIGDLDVFLTCPSCGESLGVIRG